MRRFFWGLVILILWNTVCVYWFVCGLKGLCESKVVQQVQAAPLPAPQPPTPTTEPTPAPAPQQELEIVSTTIATLPVAESQVKAPLVLQDISFLPDKAIVKNNDELVTVTNQIVDYLSKNSESKIYITAHTDLGLLRAETVKKYMIAKGVAEDRFVIESKSPAGAEEDKVENKRVHITVK